MPEVSSGSHNARDLYAYSVMLWRLLELRLFPRYENQAFGFVAIKCRFSLNLQLLAGLIGGSSDGQLP